MESWELYEWLKGLATSRRQSRDVQALARKLYDAMHAGFVPNYDDVRTLRKIVRRRVICARLNDDGSCTWLRKNAALEKLMPPRPGEKIMCRRRETAMFEGCEGYKELK
jgi:hypothetical protein